VLGQERRYTLSANVSGNPLADRAHVLTLREVGVEVWSEAAFGQLPQTVVPGTPTRTATDRVRTFAFDRGVLQSAKLEGVGETTFGYRTAVGAEGLLVETVINAPAQSGGGGSAIALPPSVTLQRKFVYQGNANFLHGQPNSLRSDLRTS
jgi:hypothetical protein